MALGILDNHMSVRALFVDYSNAFDHVDHSTLITKMAALNADPSIIRWLKFVSIKPPTTSQDLVHSVSMDHSQWREFARNMVWPTRILDADI